MRTKITNWLLLIAMLHVIAADEAGSLSGSSGSRIFRLPYRAPTNFRRLSLAFRYRLAGFWLRTLRARSQKDRATWVQLQRLVTDFLLKPHIQHVWPDDRFLVKHPRWKPSAQIRPARFSPGGAQ